MMDFKLLSKVVGNITTTIQQTAIASVRSVKAHTFFSKITNFPKTQDVKGTVIVANQKKVEKELKDSKKIHRSVLDWLKSFKLPKSFEVSNFPKQPDFPEFPEKIEVSNPTKIPPYPKSIRVSNQPTKEINKISAGLVAVVKAIKALKLNPTINVEAPEPEKVVVPAPNVTVTQEKIDYKKLAKLLAEQVPEFDYKKMGEVIADNQLDAITVGGGGSSGHGGSKGMIISGSNPLEKYRAADIDQAGINIWYYGFTDKDGAWYIMEENKTVNSFRFISGSSGYITSWAERDTLEYDYLYEAF